MGTRGVPAWLTHHGDRLRHNTSPLASCRTLRCTPRRNRPATLRSLPRLTRTRSAGCPPQQQAGRSRGGSSTKSRGTRRGRRSHRGHRPAARPGTRGLGGPAGGRLAGEGVQRRGRPQGRQRRDPHPAHPHRRTPRPDPRPASEWTEAAIQQNTTENTTLKQRVRQLAADHRTLEERLTAARSNPRFPRPPCRRLGGRSGHTDLITRHHFDRALRPGVGVRVG
jgi:hypothetical protein